MLEEILDALASADGPVGMIAMISCMMLSDGQVVSYQRERPLTSTAVHIYASHPHAHARINAVPDDALNARPTKPQNRHAHNTECDLLATTLPLIRLKKKLATNPIPTPNSRMKKLELVYVLPDVVASKEGPGAGK